MLHVFLWARNKIVRHRDIAVIAEFVSRFIVCRRLYAINTWSIAFGTWPTYRLAFIALQYFVSDFLTDELKTEATDFHMSFPTDHARNWISLTSCRQKDIVNIFTSPYLYGGRGLEQMNNIISGY
jgi:hypothetical protein